MRSIFEIKAAVSYKGNIKNGHYECLKKIGKKWISLSDDRLYYSSNPEENNFYDISYFIIRSLLKSKKTL